MTIIINHPDLIVNATISALEQIADDAQDLSDRLFDLRSQVQSSGPDAARLFAAIEHAHRIVWLTRALTGDPSAVAWVNALEAMPASSFPLIP